ncbi:hypothetical protein BH18ACT11_BH18ACT11_02900 [soil metagenome]
MDEPFGGYECANLSGDAAENLVAKDVALVPR